MSDDLPAQFAEMERFFVPNIWGPNGLAAQVRKRRKTAIPEHRSERIGRCAEQMIRTSEFPRELYSE